ncbi:xanthine dehydrogenase accessory factor [Aliiruegeria haliotis]|uniref:Xanthine dehydrogenase accessory factor n=1 Tax=Aliiruegeria haliotis TaxID=1280846 RepID=A0A2T0RM07_9RHOB|nr:xanthine dehydrogenase accessory protein XdhC [Aliiruegeria haliotis]PRY22226.1 xanthine dehydrogenase accessory factor [Aliiruegeria haliotis]
MTPARLSAFLADHADIMRVELTRVRGSSPREQGAFMLVAPDAMIGTIGGGQLEYMAIDHARRLLRSGEASAQMDVPLGPEIGQCCGGRVEIALSWMDGAARSQVVQVSDAEREMLPQVFILGAGHVGRALADQFQHLPVRPLLIDERAEELGHVTAGVETRHTALPEAEIRNAPAGSAFIVLTHDHALDFLLTSEALARNDAAYVGMIGSATKRASFSSYCRRHCDGVETDALICPIGASGSRDKRPSVIAATVVAEVITALTSETAAHAPERGKAPIASEM